MSNPVLTGSICQCAFGTVTVPLTVSSQLTVKGMNADVATILDNTFVSFGMCNSPNNPAVISATAAKAGVFTPAPCTPAIFAPWIKGEPTILVCGNPLLTNTTKLMCAWAGMVSVTMTPAQTINTP